MKLINSLVDSEYPFSEITHTRMVVRGIILNQANKIALLKIERDDIFGKASYYETPGGGQEKNESIEETLIREINEELGYESTIISELGIVEDYYNLLKRKNINHYFLAKISKKTKIHHESFGDSFIKDIIWVSIDKAIGLFESMDEKGVSKLVKNRELPILYLVKEIIGGN